MGDDFIDLFERIREHCRQQRWYGPDGHHPSSTWSRHEVSYDIRTGQKRIRDRRADHRMSGFAYPPASDEQIQKTEAALGFSLPPVLRALYSQLANGGFGPCYGLVGASGGFPSDDVPGPMGALVELYSSPTNDTDPGDELPPSVGAIPQDWIDPQLSPKGVEHSKDPTLAATLTAGDWHIPAAAARALREYPDTYLECETEPDGLVTLCHWGCGIFSKLDRWTGYVYVMAAEDRHDRIVDSLNVGPDDIVIGLQYQADSVQDWLEKWLSDKLIQGSAAVPILLDDVDDLPNRIEIIRAEARRHAEQARASYHADVPELETRHQLRGTGLYRVPLGGQIPPVVLPSTEGRDVNLAEEAQAHHLVLFFYPGDGAGLQYPRLAGCTDEACSFRDALADLHALGAAVFGVSLQPTERQRQFTEREHLTFELLSDERGQLVSALNIPRWIADNGDEFIARTTLIIERGGRIVEVYPHVQVKGHVEHVISAVRRLATQHAAAGGEEQ